MKKIILLTALLFLGAALHGEPSTYGNFASYESLFHFSHIHEAITSLERQEFSSLTVDNGLPVYNGRAITLYLLASGINTREKMKPYMAAFLRLVHKARREISSRRLNKYNSAEYLLHFLHKHLFREVITGPAAGYNIGIKETFDTGRFNCYKSALIYNALLEYFDISSSYVTGSHHIYSVVYIDHIPVEVETTNRYGFDVEESMKQYIKLFPKPGSLQRLRIHHGITLDRLRVLTQVYNNRSHVYTRRAEKGDKVLENRARAAALSILGNFLSMGRDRYIDHNTLYKTEQYIKDHIMKSPGDMENLVKAYSSLCSSTVYKNISEPHRKNLDIIVYQTILSSVKKLLKDEDPYSSGYAAKLVTVLRRGSEHIRRESGLLEELNYFAVGMSINNMVKKCDGTSLSSIETLYRQSTRLYGDPFFTHSKKVALIREKADTIILGLISNIGIDRYNKGDMAGAREAFARGVELLKGMEKVNPSVAAKLKFLYRKTMKSASSRPQ